MHVRGRSFSFVYKISVQVVITLVCMLWAHGSRCSILISTRRVDMIIISQHVLVPLVACFLSDLLQGGGVLVSVIAPIPRHFLLHIFHQQPPSGMRFGAACIAFVLDVVQLLLCIKALQARVPQLVAHASEHSSDLAGTCAASSI
jgi:hypothetical protein